MNSNAKDRTRLGAEHVRNLKIQMTRNLCKRNVAWTGIQASSWATEMPTYVHTHITTNKIERRIVDCTLRCLTSRQFSGWSPGSRVLARQFLGWSPGITVFAGDNGFRMVLGFSPAGSRVAGRPGSWVVARFLGCRPHASASGTSHCRMLACEGRPPVLGLVAR